MSALLAGMIAAAALLLLAKRRKARSPVPVRRRARGSMDAQDAAVLSQATEPGEELPLVHGHPSHRFLNDSLLAYVRGRPGRLWWVMFLFCAAGTVVMLYTVVLTVAKGPGVWGVNIPVGWGFAIINFVWWIGIGHAGTLISAILYLFQQGWRTSINRFAEAMTLFAVINAALFPALHLGRQWLFYWIAPYPSTTGAWPNFRSALPWDMAAVGTYFTVSLMFWYLGVIPDLATVRDTEHRPLRRRVYAFFAVGWRGSARHWHHYKIAYLLLAGLATPLVLSVHSIVSFDFAISVLPGWHTTIFPPYFVAGALFSGLALVLTLLIPTRAALGFENVITERHIDVMSRFVLATGLMVSYGYVQEYFFAWYSGDEYERAYLGNLATGWYAVIFWTQIVCNVLVPQLLWSARMRRKLWVVWLVSILVNVGMWSERFIIVVVPLSQDFLPSSWGFYLPTWVDLALFGGTLCFFGMNFLLFLKFVPPVAVHEVKELTVDLARDRAFEQKVETMR